MSRFTFKLRAPPPQRVDLSPLIPERLTGKNVREIAALPINTTRVALAVGDLFQLLDGDRDVRVAYCDDDQPFRTNAGEVWAPSRGVRPAFGRAEWERSGQRHG